MTAEGQRADGECSLQGSVDPRSRSPHFEPHFNATKILGCRSKGESSQIRCDQRVYSAPIDSVLSMLVDGQII